MTYQESVEYLNSFINYERTVEWEYPEALKLDRMRKLARAFGNPQDAYETILIAGTKGKGSTAAILSSILRMEDLRVGLYTSPHLTDISERIQVNGRPISESKWIEQVLELRRLVKEPFFKKNPPTYFESLTAIAFSHFKQMKVQVAVLEVGLGGLYDSTNIASTKVVGLTPISLEHTDKLGKTVAKIAVQKAGVIKGREVVVSAAQPVEALDVIRKKVEAMESQLFQVGKEIQVFERSFHEGPQVFDVKSPFGNFYQLKLELLGKHQIENAAQAVCLAKGLESKTRLKISEEAIHKGVLDARWPGRLEKVQEAPTVVLDGAHNVESIQKMLEGIKRHFHYEKCIIVLGLSEDKDAPAILEQLIPETSCFVITKSTNPRAAQTGMMVEILKEAQSQVFAEEDPSKALIKAKEIAGPHDMIVVTGSLFLLGDIKRIGC